MGKTISVSFEITDKGTFRKVTADAEKLGRAVRDVQDEAQNARRTIVKWAEVSQAFDVLHNTISELQGVISDLTSAYQVQLVAETQLNTIMRQRMNATDQEIQSVKDLCSAQQELGVIGDEVQLSGAQQMATFLQNKQSLDVLIPAMNNLIAQQNGLNATNQDAVSIGNMMGKAMQGQVEVLQRVGITFTDAQKQVLQYGNESERAAMLAQVITDNVGNMNAELAKTDAGQWKQMDNWLGDIKEQLGGMVQRLAPAIAMLSQMTMAASGIGKLASSFYTALTAVRTLVASMNIAKNVHTSMIAVSRVLAASYNGQAVGATTAAVATRALGAAVKGLLVATGVGIAIVALGEAISYLTSSSDDAASSMESLSDAEASAQAAHQQLAQQIASVRSEMDLSIAKLKDFKGSKEQEKKIVQDMNAKYGEALGYYSTVAQWYKALTANSKAYCDQMINEITIRNLANQAADLQQKRYDLTHDRNGKTKLFSTANEKEMVKASKGDPGSFLVGGLYYKFVTKQGTSQLAKVTSEAQGLYNEEVALRKRMQQLVKQAGNVKIVHTEGYSPTMPGTSSGGGGKVGVSSSNTTNEGNNPLLGSIDWYNKAINEKKKEMEATAIDTTRKQLQGEIEGLERELGMIKIKAGIEPIPPIEVKNETKAVTDQIDEQMEEFLSGFGGEPIVVDLEANIKQQDLERINSLFNIDTSNFESVQAALANIKGITDTTSKGLAIAGASCEALGGAMQQLGADSAAAKAGLVMAAIGQIALSFAQALNSASSNWVTWLAFGISGTAQMISMISTISKFATGGIVGGNQRSGDNVLVRVNSGEMILNAAQQARLFALANGTATYGASAQVASHFAQGMALPMVSVQTDRLQGIMSNGGESRKLDINLKLRGSDLVAAVANETRSNRRRSNIR